MSEAHRIAGRKGGLKGKGGRPTWQETLAREQERLAKAKAEIRGK